MARRAFTGDHIKELPKGKIEPYRLWFEFLKLALEIQPDKVDKKFYAPWGDISKLTFNEWNQTKSIQLELVDARLSA